MKIRNTAFASLLIFLLFAQESVGQDFRKIALVKGLAQTTEGFYEGFAEKTLENTFNYHSFRHDIGASMISRCLDVETPMKWKTEAVALSENRATVGFTWIAAVNLNNAEVNFTVSINGVERFIVPATSDQNWMIGNKGASISFSTVMVDRHGDGHGYMYMEIPQEWLVKGEGQEIRIVGDRAGKSTWMIIYEAKDALNFLQKAAGFDSQIQLFGEKSKSQIHLKLITIESNSSRKQYWSIGKKKHKIDWEEEEDFVSTSIKIPVSQSSNQFKVLDSEGELMTWNFNSKADEQSLILPQGVLKNKLIVAEDNEFQVQSNRSWMPSLVESILKLSDSPMANSEILLMNSSHQDIAWMDTPEKCIVERDTMLLQPLFNRAEKDPDYRFDVEDALMIKEYVQRHPAKRDLVKKLFADGRISCGATYIQPYEEMYSGEALARQFYYGAKWLKDEFDYVADTYWNVDVPGRTLQMPQLMAKAGVNNLVMTRQELGFYDWYSPDGSKVTGFSNGHYGDSYGALGSEYYITLDYLSKYAFNWEEFYFPANKKVIPVLSDWDMSPAKDYSQLISAWNGISELKNPKGEVVSVTLPKFKEALAPDMFDAFRKTNPIVNEIRGERPALWLYIHGPSHQKAMKSSREGDILLTQVEKLASINALQEQSFIGYPEERLKKAWEEKIYPDHGWGGNGGEITDAYFWQKYDFARSEAKEMLNLELNKLASKVKPMNDTERPILAFNSLSWMRSSPVIVNLSFAPATTKSVTLFDNLNHSIPIQLDNIVYYNNGFIRSADIIFVAKDLPGIGYRTYYLRSSSEASPVPMPKQGKRLENGYYIVEFGEGGLNRLYDKELEEEILLPEGFNAGEVFTLRSIGNGAGEFDQVQQADTIGFDKTGNYRTEWKLIDDGPVYTKYAYRQAIRNAVVEQNVLIYKDIKKVDFELGLLNWEGVLYREYRMALPVNAKNGKVVYEVPFGKLEVGVDEMEGDAGERYTVPAKDIHPRAIQNWVNVSSDRIGVTLSSSVTGLDYVDLTEQANHSTLIQPILIASRRSCHGLGNDYLQTGDHYFTFSLSSHKPGWENGYKFGIEANEKVLVVADFKPYVDADLPGAMSFFSLDQENAKLAVIKKAEDSDDIVIRLVENQGLATSVNLKSAFEIKDMVKTNLIEQSIGNQPIKNKSLFLSPFSIDTYKIKLK